MSRASSLCCKSQSLQNMQRRFKFAPLFNMSSHHSHSSSFPLLLSGVQRPVIKCSCPWSQPNGSRCNTTFLLPAARAPLARGTGIRKADACLCLFFTHSCCFMVFFVVEGSAGSRNNLPALGKEMYPLDFLAPVGNALLLPPPCWRGRASPNSPRDSRALAASKSCLAESDTTSGLHCQSSSWWVTSSHEPGKPRLGNWQQRCCYSNKEGFCPQNCCGMFSRGWAERRSPASLDLEIELAMAMLHLWRLHLFPLSAVPGFAHDASCCAGRR